MNEHVTIVVLVMLLLGIFLAATLFLLAKSQKEHTRTVLEWSRLVKYYEDLLDKELSRTIEARKRGSELLSEAITLADIATRGTAYGTAKKFLEKWGQNVKRKEAVGAQAGGSS